MAYVREELANRWRPYKVRPHPDGPGARRFETGTMPFEGLAGAIAAFEYLESIGGWSAIGAYERSLAQRFLDGLPDGVTLYGPPTLEGRVPTFLLNVDAVPARQVSDELAQRGIALWAHDTFYAVGLAERLPYEHEAIRIGLIHYNTAAEVDALLAELAAFAARG
jgi:selenocysteine lyase/cysteine desulfurase